MMMKTDPTPPAGCLLIYDGECRLCVTAKQGIEKLAAAGGPAPIRMITYQSDEARALLGERYGPGRPHAAYLVQPGGVIAEGLEAFLPLLPGVKGGWILLALFRIPLARPAARFLYRMVARYRYCLFGEVSSRDGRKSS